MFCKDHYCFNILHSSMTSHFLRTFNTLSQRLELKKMRPCVVLDNVIVKLNYKTFAEC